jgi:hypothetical protein
MRIHWLAAIALTAPGLAAAQEGPVWFEDVAATVGLDFRHVSGARPERPYFPEIVGGGGALCDLDGDGDVDAYLVQSGTLWEPESNAARNRLYRNRGDGTFEEVTAGSGADDRGYGMGVTVGDHDGDGDADLYVTNYGPNRLLRNDGEFRFTDVTEEAGVGDPGWSMSASFSDLDADGDLDLFVTNYVTWTKETQLDCRDAAGKLGYCVPTHYNAPSRDTLYRNDGDGTFTDISETAGMAGSYGNGLGVFCADMTGDDRPDIFVANDKLLDHLWVNDGDLQFTEDALIRGCACDEDGYAKAGMGVAVVDWDDDGDRDFLVVNFAHEADSFYENDGGFFYDRSVSIGLGFKTRKYTRFGIGFRDFDNDGWLDLYLSNGRVTLPIVSKESGDPFGEQNLLFAGTPERTLREVLPLGGAAPAEYTSRAAIFGDIDDDGGIDVLVVNRDGPAQMLRNVVHDRGAWIGFRVRERSGADALGAVVTLDVGERTVQRDVLSAQSYLAASDPRVHVGLGEAEGAGNVRVRWTDGTIETFGDRPAGAYHELRRGAGE